MSQIFFFFHIHSCLNTIHLCIHRKKKSFIFFGMLVQKPCAPPTYNFHMKIFHLFSSFASPFLLHVFIVSLSAKCEEIERRNQNKIEWSLCCFFLRFLCQASFIHRLTFIHKIFSSFLIQFKN